MLRKTFVAVALALVGAGISHAQGFATPGPEHKQLAEMVGEWNAVMEFGGQKSDAKATYKSICGGMWLESDFEGDFGGAQFQGHGIDGYDQQKKKFVGIWVDSMSSAPTQFEGTYDPKTKTTTMTGTGVGPDGKPQKFKNTTEYKDKDHFIFKMYMVQPDGQDQLAFTIDYMRKK